MGDTATLRKLTTILHADVVSYSRLMEQDEESTLATLLEYRALMADSINKLGGRVVDTAGDSLLAEYPSVVDAVKSAVEIQATLKARNADLPEDRRVQFRMGIELADVMLKGDILYGDGINVAARIQSLAETGGICVSDAVRRAVGNKIPLVFEFTGAHSVKNISEPVSVYRVLGEGDTPRSVPARLPQWGGYARFIGGAVVVAVVIAALAFFLTRRSTDVDQTQAAARDTSDTAGSTVPFSARPSIAVLPFDNFSGKEEQQYFADGITDDLITDLTKLSGLLVIARDSTFAYKGEKIDLKKIAKLLQARYILHGSVRRAGDQLRINAQLTDSTTGKHLWADRFDGNWSEVFKFQDQVTQRIVLALAVKLTTQERDTLARKDTENLDAYEYFLRAKEHFFRHSKADNREAQKLYRKALELDPNFARVYAHLAWTQWFEFVMGWTEDREAALDRAQSLAKKAISMRDDLPVAHFVNGLAYRERKQWDRAITEGKKAIALDPNFANGRILLASVLYYTGQAEEGIKRIKEAERLHPLHPHNYPFHLGQAYYILERYPEAIAEFKAGLASNPTSQRLHVWLAAAYAQDGKPEEAHWELEEVEMLDPGFSLQVVEHSYPFMYHADLKNFMDGLRKAGMTE